MNRWMLVVGLLLGMGEAAAATTVTMLDTAGDVGRYASLAIGADGLGLITYLDSTNQDLRVAHCSNVACTAATISVLDAGDVRWVGTMAIGPDGRGIVGYSGATTLKTAHCDDIACTSATIRVIEQEASDGIALTIGSDLLPLLAYPTDDGLHTAHCTVADCGAVTTTRVGPSTGSQGTALGIGQDGLGVIVATRVHGGLPDVRRCLNIACSATTPEAPTGSGPFVFVIPDAVAVPADGRPLVGYQHSSAVPQLLEQRLARCTDPACTNQTEGPAFPNKGSIDVELHSSGRPWFTYIGFGGNAVRLCDDASCESSTASCFAAATVSYASLAQGGDGRSLVAFFGFDGLGVAHDVSDPCVETEVRVADAAFTESLAGADVFVLTLSAPSTFPVRLSYETVAGTATPGADYLPISGTVTFPPGTTTAHVPVSIVDDAVREADETFSLRLSNAFNAVIGDMRAVGTITDDDMPPRIVAGHCEQIEGDSVLVPCVITVSLVGTSSQTVRVDYQTADGTATEGADYLSMAGQLVFSSGEIEEQVPVPVLGDTAVELHETFTLNLSNPVNATILDGVGEGTILDDDAGSLSSLELTHGSRLTADLAALPGPLPDQDLYRLAQPGRSSWEIVADGVSGDIAPGLVLERLAEDNSTVLQTGIPAGVGAARALRWERRLGFGETLQHIRVRSTGCSTDCGADDTYRLRVYETTVRIPRFNNSGTQVTVLLVQNWTDAPLAANVDFWDSAGALLATAPLALAPRAVGVINTLALAPLVGRSGSVSITHDGPYGALAGKAVALEPATGFSFDSPLGYRPR